MDSKLDSTAARVTWQTPLVVLTQPLQSKIGASLAHHQLEAVRHPAAVVVILPHQEATLPIHALGGKFNLYFISKFLRSSSKLTYMSNRCEGWDCSSSVPCQSAYSCVSGYCKACTWGCGGWNCSASQPCNADYTCVDGVCHHSGPAT